MSHQITTQTNITDKDLAINALKIAGWNYRESGSRLTVQSGPMTGASIDLTTGEISGDADLVNRGDDSMGALKRYYGEALVRHHAATEGYEIENREIEQQTGDIILHCTAHFA